MGAESEDAGVAADSMVVAREFATVSPVFSRYRSNPAPKSSRREGVFLRRRSDQIINFAFLKGDFPPQHAAPRPRWQRNDKGTRSWKKIQTY